MVKRFTNIMTMFIQRFIEMFIQRFIQMFIQRFIETKLANSCGFLV